MIHANKENFDSLISNDVVLVDFFATWCGPCKMLTPVLEELSNDRSLVKIVKVDIDESMDLAKRYGIMSVPTLLLFKDGKLIANKVGFASKNEIEEWIREKN